MMKKLIKKMLKQTVFQSRIADQNQFWIPCNQDSWKPNGEQRIIGNNKEIMRLLAPQADQPQI